MEWQTPIDMYIIVVGAFLPLLISIFKDVTWPTYVKKLLMLVFAFVASLGHLYFMEGVTLADLPMTMLKIGILMQGTYTWVWQPTVESKIATKVGIGAGKTAAVIVLIIPVAYVAFRPLIC